MIDGSVDCCIFTLIDWLKLTLAIAAVAVIVPKALGADANERSFRISAVGVSTTWIAVGALVNICANRKKVSEVFQIPSSS